MDRLAAPPDLAQRVYDALSDAIGSGALAPGERVTQEGLAERFGVSRQPVLQALLLLKRQGLIVDAGRKGVMVAPLDPAHVRRLYEVRAALDGAACRLAARRMDDDLKARGRALLAAGDKAMAADDPAAMIAADIDFHLFLYEASGNPLFAETAAPHWRHLRRVMGAVLRGHEAYATVWREHGAILAALIAGDGERAAQLATSHAFDAATRLAGPLETAEESTGAKP
ncbi:MAG: GntR family transcriptional regulator [Alphaproteobacteria bacterium]|nr:GntR family transcriptional regulator [Alphaproteobacteria bacterium]MCW5740546.1 GntR family transcriptional regulator [Alphaproteobacteria bacterium]